LVVSVHQVQLAVSEPLVRLVHQVQGLREQELPVLVQARLEREAFVELFL
jgi:hypothetical protein